MTATIDCLCLCGIGKRMMRGIGSLFIEKGKEKRKKEKQTPQNQSKMSLLTVPKRHHILYYYFVENIPESRDIFRRKTCSYVVNGL